jgi:ketosteroid isomerase-like protein
VIPAGGDYALEIGHYSYQATSKATKKPVSSSGRYMVLWRKDTDGVWRLHRDIGNEAPAKMSVAKKA